MSLPSPSTCLLSSAEASLLPSEAPTGFLTTAILTNGDMSLGLASLCIFNVLEVSAINQPKIKCQHLHINILIFFTCIIIMLGCKIDTSTDIGPLMQTTPNVAARNFTRLIHIYMPCFKQGVGIKIIQTVDQSLS